MQRAGWTSGAASRMGSRVREGGNGSGTLADRASRWAGLEVLELRRCVLTYAANVA